MIVNFNRKPKASFVTKSNSFENIFWFEATLDYWPRPVVEKIFLNSVNGLYWRGYGN